MVGMEEARRVPVALKALLFFCCWSLGGASSIILLQGTASVTLPYDYPVGSSFHRLYVLDKGLKPVFHIVKSVAFPNESKSGRGLFVIDQHTGSLMLSPHRKHSLAEYKFSTFALNIMAVPSDLATLESDHATVIVTVSDESYTRPDCRPRRDLCFPLGQKIRFQVPESAPLGTLLGNLTPLPYRKMCKEVVVKYDVPTEGYLHFSSKENSLRTGRLFDYEETKNMEWNISCQVTSKSETATFTRTLKLFVLDVDDNPPYVQNINNTIIELNAYQVIPGKPLPIQLTILDRDTSAVNEITINLTDPLNLFELLDPVLFRGINDSLMLLNTALVPKANVHFLGSSYNVSVIFNDTSLEDTTQDGVVEFHILISGTSSKSSAIPVSPPKEYQVVADVFRHASPHARVVQPMEVRPHEGYSFRLSGSPLFDVTPVTGIVFVSDAPALSASTTRMFHLELGWRTSTNETDRQCAVVVRVLDTGDEQNFCPDASEAPSCAHHGSLESCSGSCGRGAGGGFCHWRSQSSPSITKQYATCSPDLRTCPDGVCDELEELDPLICPQDCAENIKGSAIPTASGRGVAESASPCVCSKPGSCLCSQFSPEPRSSRRHFFKAQKEDVKNAVLIHSQPLEMHEDWSGCGTQCTTMIVVVSLIVSGLVVLAGFLLFRRWRSNPKSEDLHAVNVSLNSTCHSSVEHEASHYQTTATEDDTKLEFPRDQLLLEEVLGEGEFAKVVKGKAQNICKRNGTTVVAVKMLKDSSSPSERRDLMSELNLLKDVAHPNVIQLLGACTGDDGPLYVIMEYAEHGSLLTYLRQMQALGCDMQFSLHELLSFAGQISKGMEYLASMKVVHRDLAARNILVASGKVLKISDFGLSRDVYEGDTYLKTTKGKVPAKWMALESLESHLYTTKSDVWSYGIVLWEIITIGGCPYPGIPVERMFDLLKNGYRMPRPDGCPSSLYKIMMSCWLQNPKERPHFKELVQKIEAIRKDLALITSQDSQSKKLKKRDEGSVLQQLSSFPKLSVQRIGPYENQCLLSSSEFSV